MLCRIFVFRYLKDEDFGYKKQRRWKRGYKKGIDSLQRTDMLLRPLYSASRRIRGATQIKKAAAYRWLFPAHKIYFMNTIFLVSTKTCPEPAEGSLALKE
jgi:hypothetical protein